MRRANSDTGSEKTCRGESLPSTLQRLLPLTSVWHVSRALFSFLLTEVSRAHRARNAKKNLENVSRGPRPRDPKLVSKKSQKSLGDSPASLRRVSGKCLESVFGVFRDFLENFWGPGAGGPRDIFERARETSVRGGLVPNFCPLCGKCKVLIFLRV